ncbi:MAG: ATP-binding protein [Cellvibrionaceae bacterium]
MTFAKTASRIDAMEGIRGASLLQSAQHSWDDLALSPRAAKTFREISRRSGAGKRVAALISGPAGSGKTRAASLLARELGRQLIHIRLSEFHSRYIGETEKNLDRLFDAADPVSVVLLFDEADALFAKRSGGADGEDSHNALEIHFLNCIEQYRGLAILATHQCRRIDPLLVRRLHFAVRI